MSLRSFISFLALIALPCSAQQSNGRTYAPQVVHYGLTAQETYDLYATNQVLFTPFTTGAVAPASWGAIHLSILAPDSTSSWGVGLYSDSSGKPGSKLCGLVVSTAPVVGWNTVNVSGCGTPAANTQYWLAQITGSTTQEQGISGWSMAETCPGTTLSSYYTNSAQSSTVFPSSAGAVSAQSFCYSESIDAYMNTGLNGKNYGTPNGIPLGPWGADGNWYGGAYSPSTFINFNDGLSNGVQPTATTLGKSTHGTACSWGVSDPYSNLSGDNSGSLPPLISPALVGGAGYGGTGNISLKYTTNAANAGGYVTCGLASPYTSLSVGFWIETDTPITDAANQYSVVEVISSDSDGANMLIHTNGASLSAAAECNSSTGNSTVSPTAYSLFPNTPYWVEIQKNTSGAPNYVSIYDSTGSLLGVVSCNSGAGSHPAQYIDIGVTGSEDESAGYHIWFNAIEVSTTGNQMGP